MKLSIRWTIIIGCIVLVWGTHLITMPSTYFMTKRVLTRHMHDIMVNISDLALEQSYNHLNKARSAASINKQLLGSNVVGSEIESTSSLERYFFDQLTLYPHISGIYVGGLNGNFFMVSRHNKFEPNGFRTKIIRHDHGIRTTKLLWRDSDYMLYHYEDDPTDTYDPRTRPWFKEVIEHGHVIWTDPYIFYTAQKPGITIAGPAYDGGGNLKGIVGVDIEIAKLSTFIGKLQVGKSGSAFIIHRNGDVIACYDSNKLIVSSKNGKTLRLPKVHELNNVIIQRSFESIDWKHDKDGHIVLNKPQFASFEHNKKNYLAMFTPFPESELPWIIGVYIPEDDYLAEIKSNQIFNIIVTLFITIWASILGLFLSKKLVKPIVQLAEGARQVEKHDITTPFHLKTPFREIQETADSFSRMKTSLSDYEKKLHDSEKTYRAITTTANDAIIMIDSNSNITYFNPAAEKLSGYESDEVIGKQLANFLIPQHHVACHKKKIDNLMKSDADTYMGQTVKGLAMIKNGLEIPIETSMSKLKINDTWHAVLIVRDITERKKAAQLRKRLVNDLHDGIGGNLTNIKLLAEMSKIQAIPEQTSKNLHAIAEISDECITEIRNYMNILDETELSWKSFIAELHQYCAKMLEPHNKQFTLHVEINNEAPPPTTLLYMNVFKIIKEAVNNSIKHSDCDLVTLDTQVRDNHVQWTIKDNGPGSKPPRKEGRGLLSMTSRVKELGGVIHFFWGDGVCLTINIPFSRITVREQVPNDE